MENEQNEYDKEIYEIDTKSTIHDIKGENTHAFRKFLWNGVCSE